MMEFLMLIGMALGLTIAVVFGIWCGVIVGKGIAEIMFGVD